MRLTVQAAIAAAACGIAVSASVAAPPMKILRFATGFQQPVALESMPGDAARLYVVQRYGKIMTLSLTSGTVGTTPWLDLTSIVKTFGDGGLLSLAFAHDFTSSGTFYVYFTRQPDSQGTIMRFHADPVTRVVDQASGAVVLTYPRAPGGHNGGWIGVSPVDHFLYLSSGDGGTAADPDPINAAQTITGGQFQGKMLRIDPTGDDFPLDPDRNYRIPASNPFVGTIADPEIWAYGLRNAWRCSFDRVTGDLWMGDVGQDQYEEINREPAGSAGGRNYGWRCAEGPVCTGYGGCLCPVPGSTPPYLAYDHTVGQSITGGVVYRGSAIPGLAGQYVCADWSANKLFIVDPASPTPMLEDVTSMVEPGPTPLLTFIASIGQDAAGEIYLADWLYGRVMKLIPGEAGACCLPGGCQILSFAACAAASGLYGGNGSTCLSFPCPPIGCLADFNQDGGVDGADVEAFFLVWEAGDAGADVNADGGVDGADVEGFFNHWESGC